MELVDFLASSDAAGSGDAPGGRLLDGQNSGHAGPGHESLGVHMGIEKLVAERLEGPNRIGSREWQVGFPAVNHDVAAATIHGRDHALAPDRVGECAGELEVRRAIPEGADPR